ncbi:MAG: hypothetical protein ACKN9W_13680 [Methylococcus sp.]
MTPFRRTLLALLALGYAVVSGSLVAYALAALMVARMVAVLFNG